MLSENKHRNADQTKIIALLSVLLCDAWNPHLLYQLSGQIV